jgi:DNA-directed RNA polymerase specialized sigma24 family protein
VSDLSRDDIEDAIDKWIIGRNAERNRQILKRRILDGITYDRLAEEFELSVRQVKNIVYHGEEKIYKHI